ncbi:MAG: hypothetical protein OEM82_12910 [Acidobacteriota bacterium]|nr:hypothetical protein [Acidobacteriota bacterium]MDH3529507.1 hypothetical protein [Acidobacteriota bacterium]
MRSKRKIVNKHSRVRRERDPVPWKYCILTLVCGLLLVAGFFAAAKQHFSAVGIAMENADLRVKIAKLKDEKRRLTLSRERASSPSRISLAAKKIGFSTVPRPIIASTSTNENATPGAVLEPPVRSLAAVRVDDLEQPSKTSNQNSPAKGIKTPLKKAADKRAISGSEVASLNGSEFIKGVRE